jgi:hypothetical protein
MALLYGVGVNRSGVGSIVVADGSGSRVGGMIVSDGDCGTCALLSCRGNKKLRKINPITAMTITLKAIVEMRNTLSSSTRFDILNLVFGWDFLEFTPPPGAMSCLSNILRK